ncbi:MAG: hypothetical protein IGS03_05075 [Candidatus Sericytochromatia bacterium]|nr:hypothetical protein [Candidatus Sericytochromatia bacterium]
MPEAASGALPDWLQNSLQALQQGDWQQLKTLLAPHQYSAAAQHLLGLAAEAQGQSKTTAAHFQNALAAGGDPALWLELARLSCESGDYLSACAHYSRAQELQLPFGPADRHRQALTLVACGREPEAAEGMPALLAAYPEHSGLWLLQSQIQLALKQPAAATQAAQQALRFSQQQASRAGQAESWNQLGRIARQQQDAAAAEAAFEQALVLEPGHAAARRNLADLYQQSLRRQAARQCLLAGQSPGHRWQAAFVLPPVLASQAELTQVQQQLQTDLDTLARQPEPLDDPWHNVGRLPYYLPYLGLPEKPLLMQIARTLRRDAPALSASARRSQPLSARPQTIGLVSGFFRAHTVMDLFGHLLPGLQAQGFEIHCFALMPPAQADTVTQQLQQRAQGFGFVPDDLQPARALLADAQLDILLYLDIGMQPLSWYLAAARLAPLQLLTWGHACTTGLDSLDGFVSDRWLDLPDGQQHYSEPLLRLDQNLGQWQPPKTLPTRQRERFSPIPPNTPWYLCPQTLYKLHPDFDHTLAELVARDPQGQLILIAGRDPAWQQALITRWAPQLDLKRVHWLPPLSRSDYLQLLACGDVMLDPWPYGGGLTLMQALAMGVPIVTCRGSQLKNRIGTSLCLRLQRTEGLAEGPADYVQKALQLAAQTFAHGPETSLQQAYRQSLNPLAAAEALATCLRQLWQQKLHTQTSG